MRFYFLNIAILSCALSAANVDKIFNFILYIGNYKFYREKKFTHFLLFVSFLYLSLSFSTG